MVQTEIAVAERRVRRFRSVAEKRRIVALTLEPGASVALVARANGVNANQVFKWRRALERGELVDPVEASTALLPVTLSASAIEMREAGAKEQPTAGGAIHIEFPGRATISVECGADAVLLAVAHLLDSPRISPRLTLESPENFGCPILPQFYRGRVGDHMSRACAFFTASPARPSCKGYLRPGCAASTLGCVVLASAV